MRGLLFLLLAAGPHAATDPAQSPAIVEAVRADDLARDLRRILILADGTGLRGRSRFVDGRWERRVERDWEPVDGAVVRVRLEREVQTEARRRSSEIGRDAHDERVALARWMVTEGLYEESLRELDAVLVKDADHAGALKLIREAPIDLDLGLPRSASLSEVLSETLKHGARGTPAERELAARRIGEFAPLLNLRELVENELKRPQPSRRAFATLLAARLYRGELVPELSRRALLDPMSDVRRSAALALRTADTPAVVEPLASGLASRHHAIRVRATEALGLAGQPAAVAPLIASLAALQGAGGPPSGVRGNLFVGLQIALVTDYDVEIAQAASIGDPIVSIQESGVVHDARAQAQIDRRVEMRTTVAALRDLTHRDEQDPEAWLEWWKAGGDAWLEQKQGGAPSTRTAATR